MVQEVFLIPSNLDTSSQSTGVVSDRDFTRLNSGMCTCRRVEEGHSGRLGTDTSDKCSLGNELKRYFAFEIEGFEVFVSAFELFVRTGEVNGIRYVSTYPPMYDAIILSIWPVCNSFPRI